MTATTERDCAVQVARSDAEKALPLARAVSEPWFRCQALAAVARQGSTDRVVELADEAVREALTESNTYKRVAATAWPLGVLIERGFECEAVRHLPGLITLTAKIENPASRSDALLKLYEATAGSDAGEDVLRTLTASCTEHWKAGYILRRAVKILAEFDDARAQALAESIGDGQHRRGALRELKLGVMPVVHSSAARTPVRQ